MKWLEKLKPKIPLAEPSPSLLKKTVWKQTISKTTQGVLDKNSTAPLFIIEMPTELKDIKEKLEYVMDINISIIITTDIMGCPIEA